MEPRLIEHRSLLHTEVQRFARGTNRKSQQRRGARPTGIVRLVKAPFRRTQPAPTENAAPPGTEQPTVVAPPLDLAATQVTPAAPATQLDPPPTAPPDPAPRTGNRAKLRRRMRYLRRAHELGLRDLGGLVFDLHRFGRRNDQLVVGKLQALEAVDTELRAIERVLGAHREVIELREPGITACVRCGGLHGTDARFCPSCGTQVDGLVAVGGAPAPAAPSAEPAPAPAPTPAPAPAATPVAAPPVPATGPAPAAPPLWSVPQPTEEHSVPETSPPFTAPQPGSPADPPSAAPPPDPAP